MHVQSSAAKGNAPVPYPDTAGNATTARFAMAISAAQAATLNLILELGVLPKDCRLIDLALDTDDLDSNGAPAMTLDVGLMSGEVSSTDQTRTCGQEFFAGSVTPRTGAVERMSKQTGFRVAPAGVDRSIGVKIAAAAATGAGGVVALIATYATE